ncbi:acetyl-coenzyme A transporter 1-like [Lytechinus pictus]|uniref:acetyl-coenzyme A transporter 1-like n=1 Tax=Lytechinus pictus TaxID=7653 RepID=UPI00240D4F45|nr:acetyl-coenzyme A transporter 1-like [Lytechinus pictus]XP_054769091.1 acetyl-coenzyme A transporter 1-like [Lytechinus pictus]
MRRGKDRQGSDMQEVDDRAALMKEDMDVPTDRKGLDSEPDKNHAGCTNLGRDRNSIALLLLLYILQGIPLGLAGSIPLLLQSRSISYKQQAIFSFVYWPFSVKLLWAPIVDSVFFSRIGRRKSWLIPCQYLIGLFMMILSGQVTSLLGDDGKDPNVLLLTVLFFMLNFLAATQDIAVDGWALTMLSPCNVGYASTCNSVGQTAGYFIGNVIFIALESAHFCNTYIRWEPQEQGIVTLQDFLFFWGIVFFITTTIIGILKHEKDSHGDHEMDVITAYKQFYQILQLPVVKTFLMIVITSKMGYAAADAITGLKLIEAGVPREDMALLAIPLVPLQIIMPWFISKYTAGTRPLNIYLKAMPWRLIMGLEFAFVVWVTPSFKLADGSFPVSYFVLLLISYAVHQVALYSMFVSTMAFNARVSDPLMGGTYMTLLNTVSNLGGNWPVTVALWLVDGLSWKSCHGGTEEGLDCDTKAEAEVCTKADGKCVTDIDGYYIESILCVIIGFAWLGICAQRIRRLQELPLDSWRLPNKRSSRSPQKGSSID